MQLQLSIQNNVITLNDEQILTVSSLIEYVEHLSLYRAEFKQLLEKALNGDVEVLRRELPKYKPGPVKSEVRHGYAFLVSCQEMAKNIKLKNIMPETQNAMTIASVFLHANAPDITRIVDAAKTLRAQKIQALSHLSDSELTKHVNAEKAKLAERYKQQTDEAGKALLQHATSNSSDLMAQYSEYIDKLSFKKSAEEKELDELLQARANSSLSNTTSSTANKKVVELNPVSKNSLPQSTVSTTTKTETRPSTLTYQYQPSSTVPVNKTTSAKHYADTVTPPNPDQKAYQKAHDEASKKYLSAPDYQKTLYDIEVDRYPEKVKSAKRYADTVTPTNPDQKAYQKAHDEASKKYLSAPDYQRTSYDLEVTRSELAALTLLRQRNHY